MRPPQLQPFNLAQQQQHADERNITRQAILRSIIAFAILLIFLEGEQSSRNKKHNAADVLINKKTNMIKPTKSYPTNVSEILNHIYSPNHTPIHSFNSSGTFIGKWYENDSLHQSVRFQIDLNSREVFDSTPGFYYIYGNLKILNSGSMMFNSEIQHLVLQQSVLPVQGFAFQSKVVLLSSRNPAHRLYILHQTAPRPLDTSISPLDSSNTDQNLLPNSDSLNHQDKIVSLVPYLDILLSEQNVSQLEQSYPLKGSTRVIPIDPKYLQSYQAARLTEVVPNSKIKETELARKAADIYKHNSNSTFPNYLSYCQLVITLQSTNESSDSVSEVVYESRKKYFTDHYKYLNASISSSDCGERVLNASVMNIQILEAVIEYKIGVYGTVGCIFASLQIIIIFMQLMYNVSQSSSSRISIASLFMQTLLDAVVSLSHVVIEPIISKSNRSFSPFMVMSVLYMVIFGVFEMRMLFAVYKARFGNEVPIGGHSELERQLFQLNIRFIFAFFVTMAFVLNTFSNPIFIAVLLYSYWLPQIYYSAMTGTRRAFHPIYLFGMSFLRLYVPLYLLSSISFFQDILRDKNQLASSSYSRNFAWDFLILWTAFQVGIVYLQDELGPRFFLPSWVFPRSYDYARAIPSTLFSKRTDSGSVETTADDTSRLVDTRTSHGVWWPPISSQTSDTVTIPMDPESGGLVECAICFYGVEPTRGSYMVSSGAYQYVFALF